MNDLWQLFNWKTNYPRWEVVYTEWLPTAGSDLICAEMVEVRRDDFAWIYE